jgi:hypothetical protein
VLLIPYRTFISTHDIHINKMEEKKRKSTTHPKKCKLSKEKN